MKAHTFKILRSAPVPILNTCSTNSQTNEDQEQLEIPDFLASNDWDESSYVHLDWDEEHHNDRGVAPESKKIAKKDTFRTEEPKEMRRFSWKKSEDDQLLELFEKHGPKWSKIASLLRNRKPKQVRDRYMNVLRPGINHRCWTKEEDELLIPLITKLGKKWCQIAEYMPGRTENQVKNRFYTYINKEPQLDQSLQQCDSKAENVLRSVESLLQNEIKTLGERFMKNINCLQSSSFDIIPIVEEVNEEDNSVDGFFQLESSQEQTDPFDSMTYEEMANIKQNTLCELNY